MKTGVIYKAINKINGKIYIGQSIRYEKRKLAHISDALKHDDRTVFHSAIRKYGQENFEWEVICKSNINELNSLELYYNVFVSTTNYFFQFIASNINGDLYLTYSYPGLSSGNIFYSKG